MNFIISTIILLPLIGVYFVTAIDESDLYKDQKIKYIGLYTTLFTFLYLYYYEYFLIMVQVNSSS